jgi:hypothetical protein
MIVADREGRTGAMTVSPWVHYLAAHAWIGLPDSVLHVEPAPPGHADGHFPAGPSERIHIITAWNPRGTAIDDESNRAAQQALEADLTEHGLRWYPAEGGSEDRYHLEASAAVIGLSRTDAVALGRTYRQDAIFEWTSQDWSVVGCDVASPPSMGWRCAPLP